MSSGLHDPIHADTRAPALIVNPLGLPDGGKDTTGWGEV